MTDNYNNISELFHLICSKYPLRKAIYYKKDKNYAYFTYKQLHKYTKTLSLFLLEKNIKKNDRVAIIIDNNPSWPIAFLSLMEIGAVAIPINHNLEYEEIELLLIHSQAKFILTSINIYPRIKHAASSVSIDTLAVDFEQVLKEITPSRDTTINEKAALDDTALIVYTSGTTSTPKGVILTHRNLLANVNSLKELGLIDKNDCLIALLPFYHTYPFMVTMLLPLLSGARISFPLYYDFQEIMDCAKKTGVTIFAGVPRLFSLFHQKIKRTINNIFIAKRLLLILLIKISFPFRKYLNLNIAKFILVDLHSRFGKNMRFMVSGGAKLNRNVACDFYSWGFTIFEGYGLTETSPVVSFNIPGEYKIGSVGKPIPNVEVKIGSNGTDSGEILIKGENVSGGYYKEDELTAKAYKGRWFLSGDYGSIDKDGFLYVKGRKKEIIVLSSGKKINPYDLENYYLKSPYIEEICVFLSKESPDGDNALSAVLLPNYKQFRAKHVKQIKDKIRLEIENISRNLPSYKRIKKYTLTSSKLPRTEMGKIKRYEVEKEYSSFPASAEKTTRVGSDDKYLLSYPACRKAMNYLKKELNRPVHLDDHLELDLGLDSLEQIGLLLGFQKVTGIRINGDDALGIFTVRDALIKLYSTSSKHKAPQSTLTQWHDILHDEPPSSVIESIHIDHSSLEKIITYSIGAAISFFCRIVFMLRIKNKHNIPEETPYILAPNHTSFLDGIIIAAGLGPSIVNNTYFLGYSEYFQHPCISWATKLLRFVSIDPVMHLVETMQTCAYILHNEKILCMFPEGIRSPDGTIKNFKKGIGILAKELNIPIVPVYINGTFKAWPRHRIFPKPAKITISFGKKVTVDELAVEKENDADDYQNIANSLRKTMIKLAKNG